MYQDVTKIELLKIVMPREVGYLLNFYTASGPFGIVPKPYRLKDLSKMITTIHNIIPHVELNDLAFQMAQGTFLP